MKYAIIHGDSPLILFESVSALIKNTKITFQSILYPYVDSIVLHKPEKAHLYFYDRVILSLDFIGEDDVHKLLQAFDGALRAEIKEFLSLHDLPVVNDIPDACSLYAIRPEFILNYGYELRAVSRKLCSFIEIADRILNEFSGEVLSFSASGIVYRSSECNIHKIEARFFECLLAVFGKDIRLFS